MKQNAEEDCIVDQIQIAGEATLSRSNVPPTLVSLPLVVRPSRIKNALVGLLGAASGLALLTAGGAAFTESLAPSGLGHGIALFAVAWPICMLGVGLTGLALTCILDACRSNPVLIVDVHGLIDKRSGASVKWTEVKDAKLRKTKYGLAAVDLHLCKVVNATQNPFRVGILGFRWVPKADHILVSIAFVNKSPHTLGHTILSLAERNCNPLRIQTTT